MRNKWILGSTLSTLTGILVAALYLMLLKPLSESGDIPNQHAEWLLWFFLAIVLLSMLVNLSVLIAPPAQWLSLISAIPLTQHGRNSQLNQYQQQVQSFLQRHQQQLHRLTIQADIYLWSTQGRPVLLQIAGTSIEPAGIEDMRQLFRWMLTHQCQQGYYLSLQAPDLQADIFAREAGIQIVDLKTLEKRHSAISS